MNKNYILNEIKKANDIIIKIFKVIIYLIEKINRLTQRLIKIFQYFGQCNLEKNKIH